MVNKLALGTVQFDQDYGIANKRGKPDKDEIFKILEYAHSSGVDTLDTAFGYTQSEKVIGEFVEKRRLNFRIISKLPALDRAETEDVRDIFHQSLARLRIKRLYGYLIHRFDNFIKHEGLWHILEGLKEAHLVEKIGFSLYRSQELEAIAEKRVDFDILQVPYSVFDRRFEDCFQRFKEKGVEVHVRSVFLQGLAFLEPDSLPENLTEASDHLARLQTIASESELSISSLCLNFALLNSHIDKVIIGVDSLAQLKRNIDGIGLLKAVDIVNRLDSLRMENEDILLPHNWDKR